MFERLRDSLDLALFWDYRVMLLAGLSQNALIFLGAAMLAVVLAFAIGTARLSRHRPLRWAATGYAELFRNTPEYILLVWVYYILPVLISRLVAAKFDLNPQAAAIIALGVAYSGFMSETVRAGLLSVPSGHREAGLALGLSEAAIVRRIVLPQAVRRMLPEMLNQFISLFKATSIVSLISVPDIMYRVSMVNIEEMRPLPLYTGAALTFCLIIIAASLIVQRLTDRWRRRGWA
ncbi:MAG: amino acid ABC transporter permease [Rhizobiales bacterium]|nr:amino acid ABC transporter permease [Hyphomicrobiales bacterium]